MTFSVFHILYNNTLWCVSCYLYEANVLKFRWDNNSFHQDSTISSAAVMRLHSCSAKPPDRYWHKPLGVLCAQAVKKRGPLNEGYQPKWRLVSASKSHCNDARQVCSSVGGGLEWTAGAKVANASSPGLACAPGRSSLFRPSHLKNIYNDATFERELEQLKAKTAKNRSRKQCDEKVCRASGESQCAEDAFGKRDGLVEELSAQNQAPQVEIHRNHRS